MDLSPGMWDPKPAFTSKSRFSGAGTHRLSSDPSTGPCVCPPCPLGEPPHYGGQGRTGLPQCWSPAAWVFRLGRAPGTLGRLRGQSLGSRARSAAAFAGGTRGLARSSWKHHSRLPPRWGFSPTALWAPWAASPCRGRSALTPVVHPLGPRRVETTPPPSCDNRRCLQTLPSVGLKALPASVPGALSG